MHLMIVLTLACQCALSERLETAFKGLPIQSDAQFDASSATQFDDNPNPSLLFVETGDQETASKFLQSEPKTKQASLKQESREPANAVESNKAPAGTDRAKPAYATPDDDGEDMEDKIDPTYHMGRKNKEFLSKSDRRNRHILSIAAVVTFTFGGLLLFIVLATRG